MYVKNWNKRLNETLVKEYLMVFKAALLTQYFIVYHDIIICLLHCLLRLKYNLNVDNLF